ncbi:MAG TPA: DUF1835 domain-containing protein [Planctomycetota bacterium]|nr:DUF1835 domain-containing protein [Planctomycetota bacterium]
MLHITNGDVVRGCLRVGGVPGDMVAWNDVLHEGPVPAELSHAELSKVRAAFITSRGWCDPGEVMRDVLAHFRRRDRILARYRDHDEVVLWFEHDLHDQLQLIQLLAWFAECDRGQTRLSLVQAPDYLGSMDPRRLARLFPRRRPVTARQLALGARAWDAFRHPEPTRLAALIDGDTSALPFLDGAILRLLEEYPSTHNGLSRTEERALGVIDTGRTRMVDAFFATARDCEERVFLSDLSFRSLIEDLAGGPSPLLRIHRSKRSFLIRKAALTRDGRAVLAGKADSVRLRGLDRWLGGVHLRGREVEWRWNRKEMQLEPGRPG